MDIRTPVRFLAVLVGFGVTGGGVYFLMAKKNKVGILLIISGLLMALSNILALLVF